MVVTWGEPLLTTEPTILDISWEECLQKCWSDGRCVMIYDNTSTCEYHSIQQVTTVQKLSENNNSRVAFRVPYSVNETCEGSDNESILRSGTVQSFYQGAVQMFPYEVTLQNDIWKFTPEFSCEFPSSPVQRGNVTVCMEVVHTTECINRTEAAAKCGNLGIPDSLMGIASKEENQYLRSISTNYVSKQKTPTYYTEFDFSDPTAPDPQFDWLPNQPDALTAYEAESNCLYLRFGSEAYVAIGDTQCTDVVFPSIDMCYSGYLCGSDAVKNY
ncbi:hypothetical protein GCK72_019060 [Caenorhabditis remanei]|uniref:PAN-3 domain-containing protein n=1 Tax=Caenorhabditis remanei TaxID=31234 RepID=A0A6A5GD00_CAERE|nr:hypothetical protein GCK72_019060 [Caenorhabditis remanei]KAF1752505.1 hypothetical protein GCK72_019060 [Caenorhabditis remanei]